MKDRRYFVGEVNTADIPISLNILDLETGSSEKKEITYFMRHRGFFNEMSSDDIFYLGLLLGQNLDTK